MSESICHLYGAVPPRSSRRDQPRPLGVPTLQNEVLFNRVRVAPDEPSACPSTRGRSATALPQSCGECSDWSSRGSCGCSSRGEGTDEGRSAGRGADIPLLGKVILI